MTDWGIIGIMIQISVWWNDGKNPKILETVWGAGYRLNQ